MSYKDKLRSAKKLEEKNELDKAGVEMQKFPSPVKNCQVYLENINIKRKDKVTSLVLDKAGGEMQNFGNNNTNGVFSSFANKIRAFPEGGWTGNEHIRFGAKFGILVLVAGMAVAYGNDLNISFDITGINLQDSDTEAFGNYVEKVVDNARVDFEKFSCDMHESFDSIAMDMYLKKFNSDITEEFMQAIEALDKASRTLGRVGNYVERVVHNAGIEIQNFSSDLQNTVDDTEMDFKRFDKEAISIFDKAGEELEMFGIGEIWKIYEKFGKNMEEEIDNAGVEMEKVNHDIQKSLDKSSVELGNVENDLETNVKKFGKEALNTFDKAGEELEKLGKYIEEEIDNAGAEMENFNHDVQDSFDRTTTDTLSAFLQLPVIL